MVKCEIQKRLSEYVFKRLNYVENQATSSLCNDHIPRVYKTYPEPYVAETEKQTDE